jgi:hypothetical protein
MDCMAVLRAVAPCSLVDIYRHFIGAYCFHNQVDEMLSSSKTSVNIYQTTRCYMPEDFILVARTSNLAKNVCKSLTAEREQVRKIHNMSFR